MTEETRHSGPCLHHERGQSCTKVALLEARVTNIEKAIAGYNVTLLRWQVGVAVVFGLVIGFTGDKAIPYLAKLVMP